MSDERRLPMAGRGRPGSEDETRPHGGAMDRRHALKVMALAAGGPALAAACSAGDADVDLEVPSPTSNPRAAGTAWDPDLVSPSVPWERSLSDTDLASLAVLCDVIIPADDRSPSASAVGAHDFIDEWVSAPYPPNERDKILIQGGLLWLDREAETRFGSPGPEIAVRFGDLTAEQQHQICDDICYLPAAAPGHESAARFFDRVRYLTSTAFWTTTEGMADLEYIGNVPLQRWDPPPPEVLRHIGLE